MPGEVYDEKAGSEKQSRAHIKDESGPVCTVRVPVEVDHSNRYFRMRRPMGDRDFVLACRNRFVCYNPIGQRPVKLDLTTHVSRWRDEGFSPTLYEEFFFMLTFSNCEFTGTIRIWRNTVFKQQLEVTKGGYEMILKEGRLWILISVIFKKKVDPSLERKRPLL